LQHLVFEKFAANVVVTTVVTCMLAKIGEPSTTLLIQHTCSCTATT